jgi:hypothetical protein
MYGLYVQYVSLLSQLSDVKLSDTTCRPRIAKVC